MDIKYLLLLLITALVSGYRECPKDCVCNLDERGRIQTICNRGGMSSIPVNDMDPKVEVLIIRGPRNDLTIGPMFIPLKQLEILRITDSNVPSVGTYSFWGVERLRILGNIQSIAVYLSAQQIKYLFFSLLIQTYFYVFIQMVKIMRI